MSEERLKQICKEEFLNNIKNNIKSGTIFIYVDGLEKELNKYKQAIDKIKKFSDENYDYEYRLFCETIDEILEEIE